MYILVLVMKGIYFIKNFIFVYIAHLRQIQSFGLSRTVTEIFIYKKQPTEVIFNEFCLKILIIMTQIFGN